MVLPKFNKYIFWKSVIDFVFSSLLIFVLLPFIFVLFILATIDTKSYGLFLQIRIGMYGKPFKIFKVRTINPSTNVCSRYGGFLRKSKLDELPQLFNIFLGQMSFVGPRPDIPGYYDKLVGKDREVLQLKPGVTSRASIKYINEEEILNNVNNPGYYNDKVIFPEKVKMNLEYLRDFSLKEDLLILRKTYNVYFKSKKSSIFARSKDNND